MILEKKEKTEKNYYFKNCNDENPFLKDWLVLESKPKTESRFADLFKEIIEKDKKVALEEKNDINNKNNINDKELDNKNNIQIES